MNLVHPSSPNALDRAGFQFQCDGFAVLREFMTGSDLDHVRSEIDRYIRDVAPGVPRTDVFYADKADAGSLLRLSHMEIHDSRFAALGSDGRFPALAKDLLRDGVKLESIGVFGKAPRIGEETPPHQDGYYFKLEPNEALTMWLALDVVDEDNGCLRYVPGSHRGGMRPHARTERFGFSQGITDFGADDLAAEVAVTARPGDLIVHHSMTIHRADPNRSDRRRWGFGLVYFAARARIDEAARQAYREKLNAELSAEKRI